MSEQDTAFSGVVMGVFVGQGALQLVELAGAPEPQLAIGSLAALR